jgi:NADPH-dependent ferric siderophore reductase
MIMTSNVSHREFKRVRHELRMRDVSVIKTERISPNFMAVTFGGESLADFTSLSFGDHIKLMLNNTAGEQIRRDYTPRSINLVRKEVVIEFALHEGGFMADWAAQAKPGDTAIIGGPRGSLVFPDDYANHILVGDPTALPAIHRRIDELPAGVTITVFARVEALSDVRLFPNHPQVQTHWVTSEASLYETISQTELPVTDTFVWGGGEYDLMKRLEHLLTADKGIDPKQVNLCSYWRKGIADFHEQPK